MRYEREQIETYRADGVMENLPIFTKERRRKKRTKNKKTWLKTLVAYLFQSLVLSFRCMRGSVCRSYLIINHRCEREQECVLKESLEGDKTNIKETLKVLFLSEREREGKRETERSSAMNILVILCLRHFDRCKKKKTAP